MTMMIILLILPSNSQASQISWSNEIQKGESYSWTYLKNEGFRKNKQIQVGDTIKIDILKNLDGLEIENQTCWNWSCNFQNTTANTLDQYFSMTLNGTAVDSNLLSLLLPILIHPLTYIDENNQSHSISSNEYTTKNGDEYIYKYSQTIPDGSSNITIIWQTSGVMNYYDVVLGSIAGPTHTIIIRDGYSTNTSKNTSIQSIVVFPAIFFSVIIYRKKVILKNNIR